tara:strand:- start:4011 stop:4487 length:477 start_codon:yes stop_codon:yes gene_type:complete
MEKINGRIKEAGRRSTKQALDMGRINSNRCTWHFWLIPLCLLSLTGCGSLKSSLITGAATSAVVGATSVLVPGAIVPAVAGGVTAVTASALSAEPSVKGEPISVTADTVVNNAPDNFWTLLGKLISMGGWALILIVIVPMLFSWLLPGPIQFKGKKKR